MRNEFECPNTSEFFSKSSPCKKGIPTRNYSSKILETLSLSLETGKKVEERHGTEAGVGGRKGGRSGGGRRARLRALLRRRRKWEGARVEDERHDRDRE